MFKDNNVCIFIWNQINSISKWYGRQQQLQFETLNQKQKMQESFYQSKGYLQKNGSNWMSTKLIWILSSCIKPYVQSNHIMYCFTFGVYFQMGKNWEHMLLSVICIIMYVLSKTGDNAPVEVSKSLCSVFLSIHSSVTLICIIALLAFQFRVAGFSCNHVVTITHI